MVGWEWKYVGKVDQFKRAALKATRRWLGRVGGWVRKVSRRSLKVAKQKRSDDELTDYELDRWVMMNVRRRREGLETPAPFPDRTSKPGKPPLLHDRNSPLKRLISYHADAEAGEVLIGPERARSAISKDLEFGNQRTRPRPFMGPAEESTRPHITRWWEDAIVA